MLYHQLQATPQKSGHGSFKEPGGPPLGGGAAFPLFREVPQYGRGGSSHGGYGTVRTSPRGANEGPGEGRFHACRCIGAGLPASSSEICFLFRGSRWIDSQTRCNKSHCPGCTESDGSGHTQGPGSGECTFPQHLLMSYSQAQASRTVRC